ncbi:IKK1 [Cordylochernes scorpioides]|uniref:IKK1 n=1 Tax=Cordylochernes scorpioides TaxID=51811 RepID=A0ABY6KU01_9ARAC|nr:IKK1 [Cordylochernes scorpioides]
MGRKFQSIEEIKVESKKAMKAIPKTDYQRCFADWKKRWLKCIAVNGDYFEGDNLNLAILGCSHLDVCCRDCRIGLSVVMNSNREFENRAAIIVALRAGRSPKEIVDFLKLPKTTIYRVKKQFDEADSNKEGIATRKKHSRRSDRVRGEEFVKNAKEKIDGNPGKSMRAIAKEMDVGSMTIVRTIHEDLGLKSYALRKGQLLTENMKNNRKGKAAALLNNLKHDSFGMLRFFSDERNFDVDQKVNPRNDRWICKDPSEIPVVMHTKFPASVMVLGVISSEGDVMPPHFFEKGLRMNADTYINVLETVVKPWMDMVAAGRKDVNKAPHTTIQSVKKAVHTVMTQMDKVIVAKACASFRTRLETVVANNGNFIE